MVGHTRNFAFQLAWLVGWPKFMCGKSAFKRNDLTLKHGNLDLKLFPSMRFSAKLFDIGVR